MPPRPSPPAFPTSEQLDAALGARAVGLSTPALVIDRDAAVHNIRAMIQRAGTPSRWRPHIKTIKQAPLVEALFAAGVHQLKCATPLEASLAVECAARLGCRLDLLVAYPLARPGVEAILELAGRAPTHVELSLLADDPEHAQELNSQCAGTPGTVGLFLDVDLGMQRTGQVPATWSEAAAALASLSNMKLRGLHGYDGHHTTDAEEAAHAGYDQLCRLAETMLYASSERRRRLELITSGTHSYAYALSHERLKHDAWEHTVSPGTIVLSDLRSQVAAADLGLRQAAFVATRVVSTSAARVTLDAGSKGLAPDTPPESCFALGYPKLRGTKRSEEHLVCELEAGAQGELPRRGELLWIVPEHVCTTVNMYRQAVHLSEEEGIETVPVQAASRFAWGLTPGDPS